MPNYKQLYFELFCNVSDIIEQLQKIQSDTEEKYLSFEDDDNDENENPLVYGDAF